VCQEIKIKFSTQAVERIVDKLVVLACETLKTPLSSSW
jgi:hypothetical protein